jgi:hypothetical protein
MRLIVSGITMVMIGVTTQVIAFETTTHAAMTSEALAKSQFSRVPSSSEVLRRLGLLDYDLAFGSSYIDIGSTATKRDGFRETDKFALEALVIDRLTRSSTGLIIPDSFTLGGWLMRGAIREDDNPIETPASDEPGSVFSRVYGHFFDPVNNSGLRAPFIPVQARAVDWALSKNFLADGRENHFKITDVREAMWRALTLKASDGSAGFNDNVYPTNWQLVRKEDLRKAYWATVFRSLGDVVHLLQDMAQPQHTRNDPHSGLVCLTVGCIGGHASFFEKYVEARTLATTRFRLDEGFQPPVAPGEIHFARATQLDYVGTPEYPVVAFGSYEEYFGGNSTGAANETGTGLANYTNRGFYSAGTNIGSAGGASFPSPPRDGAGLAKVTVVGLTDMTGTPIDGQVTFLQGTVRDTANAAHTKSDVRLSSQGLFDEFLEKKNLLFSRRTLNHHNYDDQAALAVPRAVAYSAGLIDYFFRGRLSVTPGNDGVYAIVDHSVVKSVTASSAEGFKVITANIANQTPDIGQSHQDMIGGTLVAVVQFHRNSCYTESLSGEWGSPDMKSQKGALVFEAPDDGGCRTDEEEILVSTPISPVTLTAGDPPQSMQFNFSPPIPINATDLKLQVVYRGSLGQETDAVVAQTADINEPYFTAYTNVTDNLLCVANHWYVRDATGRFPPGLETYTSKTLDDVKIAYERSDEATQADPLLKITVADPRLSTLEPNQSIRYAVLAPLGAKWGIHWKDETVDNWKEHNTFPSDLTVFANQVYLTSPAPGQLTRTNRARDVLKARKLYTAAGVLFHGGDGSSCDLTNVPEDQLPAPTLLPVHIMKAPFNE